MFAFINDRKVRETEAFVPIFDRGFLYGDGVFETLRVYNGKVFRVDAHLVRLFNNLKRLEISSPFASPEIRQNILQLICDNGVRDGFVRLLITRGTSDFGLATLTAHDPLLVIYAHNHAPPSPERYKKGIAVVVSRVRSNAQSEMEITKTICRVHHVLAKMEAEKAGVDDAVMLNTDGHLAEGTTSNLFLVKNGAVLTPPVSDGLLPGITRAGIREVSDSLDVPFKEQQLKPEQLFDADEAFLSSTLIELMPIVTVDGKKIGNGKPGPVTQRLHVAFQKLVSEELDSEQKATKSTAYVRKT